MDKDYTTIWEFLKEKRDGKKYKKLAHKSKLSEDTILKYLKTNEGMTLLEACKISIGLQRFGIYADEFMLLGEEQHEKLFNECFMRSVKGGETDDDKEYWELQKTALITAGLVRRRKAKGLLSKEFADLAGIERSAYAKYESGEVQISKSTVTNVYKVAKALDCRIEDLIREEYLHGENS